MAKQTKKARIDLDNLSQQEKDILTLEVNETMRKYKLVKQAVYDKRHALKKRIEAAGLTVEQVVGEKTATKKASTTAKKRGRPKKETAVEQPMVEARGIMVVPKKDVPVIMKPVEMKFETFSIKLNGVPRHISVNPETHSIEIDF